MWLCAVLITFCWCGALRALNGCRRNRRHREHDRTNGASRLGSAACWQPQRHLALARRRSLGPATATTAAAVVPASTRLVSMCSRRCTDGHGR